MMSYYGQGDFYGRGGYYRGDPGFFSFVGKLAKGALGAVPVIGPALSGAIGGVLEKKAASTAVKVIESPSAAGRAMQVVQKATGIIKKHPVLSAAGAAGAAGALVGAGGMKLREMMGGQKKHRRMNPCNARALRRAIRRATAFERLAKKVIGFSSPRKPRGHMYFKRKRKR